METEKAKIRILLADDHGIFIGGLNSILKQDDRFEVAGIASNGKEVIDLLRKERCEVLILDVNMPVMDGPSTLREIERNKIKVKVLVLTAYTDRKLYKELLNLGALGILNKNDADENLINALEQVIEGEKYLSDLHLSADHEADPDEFQKKLSLTRREKEVLALVAQEMTSKEIADKLFISEETAKTHRKNLIKKLGVKGVAGLVKFALRNNLLSQ